MEWLTKIHQKHPLVECLTNLVTIQDVANLILATGASPVMAMEDSELQEMITLSQAVLLNIGTATQADRPLFLHAAHIAKAQNKPVILDPVGAGASAFRTRLCINLLQTGGITLIRGNASEIKALEKETNHTAIATAGAPNANSTRGVDASADDEITGQSLETFITPTKQLASHWNCIVSLSGAIDIITDGVTVITCRNGIPAMSKVTGTGCSLSGITAAFLGAADSPDQYLEAAVWAVALMGCAGEIAASALANGLASFRIALQDAISCMNDQQLTQKANLQLLSK